MARKITISLRKGGSGKTTTAVNLATALHQRGKRTLLVDLDPQAHSTLSVGVDPLSQRVQINTLLTDAGVKPEGAIIKTGFGLSLLPAHPDLASTEAGMEATQVGVLGALLRPLDESFDFIVVDTPPAESFLTVGALAASDEVIIPLQAHYLAMRGLQDALEEIEQVKKGLNPSLKVGGILPVMVSNRTNIAKTVLEAVRRSHGRFLYPIQVNFSIKHAEASLAGLPIVIYAPKHQGSKAYLKLANLVIDGGKR